MFLTKIAYIAINKTSDIPLEINAVEFKLLSKLTRKKIVALGGISKSNLKILKMLNINQFSAISYFE